MLNESDQGSVGFIRRHLFIITGAVVLALGAIWFVHHTKQQNAANVRPQFNFRNNAMAVSVAKVQTGDIVVRIPALGAVTALTTVTVQSQIAGVMQEVAFKEGQMVEKGQFLAQIDPRPYEATLAQAKATLSRDQALLADARLDLKRYEDLVKQDSISTQTMDTQRATVGQDEGNVAADQAAIRTAELNVMYCHITSPVAGRVGLRQVDPGNYVTPGQTNGLVVVTQLTPMSVLFAVPEDNVNDIFKQLKDGQSLNVEASDRTDSHQIAVGHLSTTDNQIDNTTGTLKLRALFDNKDLALFPGQFVNINLVLTTLKDQVVIPTAAVRRGAPNGVQSSFVYVVNANSTVSVRPVTLGQVDGEHVIVKTGVDLGEVVVTDGGDRLRDGAQVQLPEATAAEVAKAKALKPKDSSAPGKRKFRRNGFGGPGGPPGGGPPGGGPPPG